MNKIDIYHAMIYGHARLFTMAKNSMFNRMPKTDSSKKSESRNRKRIDDDTDDQSDSSVDSHGNIRNLIDYDDETEEDTPKSTRRTKKITHKAIDKDTRRNNKNIIVTPTKKVRSAKQVIESTSEEEVHHPPVRRKPTVKKEVETAEPKVSSAESKVHVTRNKQDLPSKRKRIEPSSDDMDDEESEEPEEESEEYEEELEDKTETESEPYSVEEDEEDEEDIEESEEEYEDDEEDEDDMQRAGKDLLTYLILRGANGGHEMDNVPQKYNMKKESAQVKQFVKLLTTPVQENSIDTQIKHFKELSSEKQNELIVALENRPTNNGNGFNLMLQILTMKLPKEIQSVIMAKYNSLQSLEPSSNEYFKLRAWLDKVVSIPFGIYKDIPVRLEDGTEKCSEFMKNAKKCLDNAVYGQEESKLQVMQFICSKIANPQGRGLCLLLVGPPGVGKTSIIKNGIANALGWPFQFISLGGDSDASTYTGHQMVYESSHCGKIVNSLIASKSMSTVLMFDEIDKISQTPKGEEVMNLLVHLTDPVQNGEFEDKYLAGIPIDLSKVMFVFSANDINKIDKVLLDRMVVIDLKGYDVKQKTVIAEQYLLPAALKEVNLTEKVAISKEILVKIIEEYAKDEKGVRELKRSIEQVTQKINMLRMYNSPDLPFHIKDFSLPFIVKKDHVNLFIKKKEDQDPVPHGMYL